MNTYIEHDRQNYCMRTMSEDEVRLHYGAQVLAIVYQDGSMSLRNGVDIYLDSCYPSAVNTWINEGYNALQSMQQSTNRL